MENDNIIDSLFGGINGLWNAIGQQASSAGIEVTKMMLELFYVLKSDSTNPLNKILIGAALAYQLLPTDALPREKYKWLGLLDNGLTLAFAYNKVKSCVTPEIENQVKTVLSQWFGKSIDVHTHNSGSLNQGNTPYIPSQSSVFGTQRSNTSSGIPNSQNSRPWSDEDVIID